MAADNKTKWELLRIPIGMGEVEYLVNRNDVTLCHTGNHGFALMILSTLQRDEGYSQVGDKDPLPKEWIFDTLETRDTIFRTMTPDISKNLLAGYITALYDTGYLSWNDTRDMEKKYDVTVFDGE